MLQRPDIAASNSGSTTYQMKALQFSVCITLCYIWYLLLLNYTIIEAAQWFVSYFTSLFTEHDLYLHVLSELFC